jgi:hypothetical protein
MNTSRQRINGNGRSRFRRNHRWAGATLVAFVLFLSLTGIALNHSTDLGLDRRYVTWNWLLEAYGMGLPESYAGMVTLDPLVVVGDGQRVHVLLTSGELVESIDLGMQLPGGIDRVGVVGDRAILQSGGNVLRSDADLTEFHAWADSDAADVTWSDEVAPDTAGLEALEATWRGHGLTVERVLLDLHSGRLFRIPGRLLLDIVAIGLILLSISGLILARRPNNGR